MTVRTLEEKKVVAIRVNAKLRDRIDKFCEDNECTITLFMESVIKHGIDKAEKEVKMGLIERAKKQLEKLEAEKKTA